MKMLKSMPSLGITKVAMEVSITKNEAKTHIKINESNHSAHYHQHYFIQTLQKL